MGFIRRLLGGSREDSGADERARDGDTAADERAADEGAADEGAADAEASPETIDEAERAHELDLARSEQARLNELQQRQLRYADHAWTPPQGGEKRADNEDASPD